MSALPLVPDLQSLSLSELFELRVACEQRVFELESWHWSALELELARADLNSVIEAYSQKIVRESFHLPSGRG